MRAFGLVLRGGRVIDPETGLDGVRDVGVDDGTIRAVSAEPLAGRDVVDVTGLVVCPGLIDLHSHGQGVAEQRLQALDGVTTALELEAGIHPVDAAYRAAAREGRPINYGFATSWALARMAELAGVAAEGRLGVLLAHLGDPEWQRPADRATTDRILARLERDLADGALGIGVLVGYAPGSDPAEYLEVAGLAARAGRPTFTHARDLVANDPGTPVDGAQEVVRAAAETGAHMHYCHVNSTSGRRIDEVLALVERARAEGARVSTEAYPYGAGMTGIGAVFLAPDRLALRGMTPRSIGYLPTGERVADTARLEELRRTDPGGLAFIHTLDEDDPADRAYLSRALAFPGSAFASDAMPLHWGAEPPEPRAWPLPARAVSHPRGAGTFGRALRTMVREQRAMDLPEAIRRCTLVPADVLGAGVPAMRGKGRVQAGRDADLTVLDAETVSDRSTYTDTTRPSTGFRHVIVNGAFIVRDGNLDPGALPGRPIRA